MNIEQSIKDHAKSAGMDLCGIAPVSRFDNAPEGTKPGDFLPGCKSVISFAVRLADGAVQTIFRGFEDNKPQLQGIYGTYGYTILPNFHLMYATYSIAQFIERGTGFTAMPTQSGPWGNGITMSQRHAAVAAGLGEFGWHSIVVTPEFGPRNRFGCVLTTAELEPDPLYNGPRLCDPASCTVCSTVCPTGAISKYGEREARQVTYPDRDGDRTFDYCHLDMTRCRIGCQALLKKTGGDRDRVSGLDATAQEVQYAEGSFEKSYDFQQSPTWKCGKCLAYCPVGDWARRFKDTGLSSRLPLVHW